MTVEKAIAAYRLASRVLKNAQATRDEAYTRYRASCEALLAVEETFWGAQAQLLEAVNAEDAEE